MARLGLFLLVIGVFPFAAFGQNLSELAVFARCYSHLTQKDLPPNHALKAQVKAGTLSAVNACMQIFDSARLGSNGRLASDTQEGRDVLLTMNDFHRTWFPNDNIMKAIPFLEDYQGQPYLYDEGEAALHVTRALLSSGVNYSEIVTAGSGMEALRSNGDGTDHTICGSPVIPADQCGVMLQRTSCDSGNTIPISTPLVQTGTLLGVRPMSQNSTKQNATVTSCSQGPLGSTYLSGGGQTKIYEGLGGGILGTRSYLLLNMGRPNQVPSDGGIQVPRRWSRAVISDILCRELPVVRVSDATPFVQGGNSPLTPPFRKAGTCMSCHSTIDPMAGVIRNLSYGQSHDLLAGGTIHLYRWPATQPPESGPVDLDENYFERPTRGTFYFRSYDGTLLNNAVSSLAELGQAMANSKDLYACAAARYFQHFTGIKVNLQDIGDPANTPLKADDLAYRNQVIQLGEALKSNQSLRSLVQSIISSSIYKKSNMRN